MSLMMWRKLLHVYAVGGAPPWTPADLGATLLTWLEADPAYLFQDSAGTTPVTADTNPVGLVNAKGGSVNATQATSSARPLYRTGAGLPYLQLDGADDYVRVLPPAVVCNVYLLMRTADNYFCLAGSSSPYAGLGGDALEAGGAQYGAGSVTYAVGGVDIPSPNRDGIHTAFSTGNFIVGEMRTLDARAWDEVRFCYHNSTVFATAGDVAAIIITDASTETTQDRDNIRAYLQGLIP